MLGKTSRTPKKEIGKVAKLGKKIHGDLFDVKYFTERELTRPKFTFVVSIKVSKHSTVRNKIKRLLRAACWNLREKDFFSKSHFMFIAKDAKLAEMKSYELEKMIKEILWSDKKNESNK